MADLNAGSVELTESLLGMKLEAAEKVAAGHGFKIEDRTERGWYTQEYDRHRIVITLDKSGHVATANLG